MSLKMKYNTTYYSLFNVLKIILHYYRWQSAQWCTLPWLMITDLWTDVKPLPSSEQSSQLLRTHVSCSWTCKKTTFIRSHQISSLMTSLKTTFTCKERDIKPRKWREIVKTRWLIPYSLNCTIQLFINS